MANTSRPTLRSSSGRFSVVGERSPHLSGHLSAASPASRKSLRHSIPIQNLPHSPKTDILPPESTPSHQEVAPSSLQRLQSRKRKSTAISDDASLGRKLKPPTKVTIARSHGELLETVNGVQRHLTEKEDDIVSQRAAQKVVGTSATPNNVRMGKSKDGLNASKVDQSDKRTLRSQDGGSRLKSDLAIYFANYDDVITDAPQEPEFLGFDTPILIIDEPSKASKARSDGPRGRPGKARSKTPPPKDHSHNKLILTSPNGINPTDSPVKPSSTSFQVVDFSSINRNTTSTPSEDPLSDSTYFAPHRRAERKEKQLRNIEKERAMHEKVQLERLLEGLKGPDWLKVMGITGITDGERKEWEPKRNYFIAEVRALVDKFKIWKEEEKRQKMEREALLHAKEEEEEEDEAAEEEQETDENEEGETGCSRPPSSDGDAEAAKQLQLEASSAAVPAPKTRVRLAPSLPGYLPPPEVDPNKPFTSFYSKPHLRAAALGQHRHGRSVMAFGHPLPEWCEDEFGLPHDYLTPAALEDHARKKRRMKREQASNTPRKS